MPDALPKHYVLITVGTHGDVYPFMRLGQTLQGMGHRVTLITNHYHHRVLQGAGLDYIGLGTDDDYLRFISDPRLWDPNKGFESVMADYRQQLLQMAAAIRSATVDGPAVALAFPFAVPAAMMAKELGHFSRVASVYLAPSTLRTCHHPMRIGDHIVPKWVPVIWRKALWRMIEKRKVDPTGVERVNSVRRELELPPMRTSFLDHIEHSPDFTVTLFPTWFASTMPDWPTPLITGDFQQLELATPEVMSDELSAFIAAGDSPLVFSPGTGNVQAKDFFVCALSAVQAMGERAVFLTQDASQLPANLPPNVLWQSYASLSALLPHTKALIHHGGIGTTAEAMRTGTPQLVTAFGWDQYDNGARAAEMGAGLVTSVRKLTPEKLKRAIQTLTSSDNMRASCAKVARHFDGRQEAEALCADIDSRFQDIMAC